MRTVARPVISDGKVIGLEGAIQDITTFTALSEAVMITERRQRLIADCAELGTWDWDVVRDHAVVNKHWCTMLGLPFDEAVPNTNMWRKLIHPEDRRQLHFAIKQHFEDPNSPYSLEHRVRHASGEWVWVLSAGRVYERDLQGKPLRMAGILLDITNRKESELRARKLQHQNELIVDNVLNAVITLDENVCVTGWNRRAEQILGYAASEAMGQAFLPLVFGQMQKGNALCVGQDVEAIAYHQSGREITVEYSVTLLEFEDGVTYVVVLSDISSRKEQIHHQKLESIGLLATGIAHEINAPMQYIGDNTEYVSRASEKLMQQIREFSNWLESSEQHDLIDAKRWWKQSLENIKFGRLEKNVPNAIEDTGTGIERVVKIVRAMKDFSHPGAAKKIAINLNECIRNTLTICHNRTKYMSEVIESLDDSIPAVECHPTEIGQVVLNLVVNALDAIVARYGSERLGEITVQTRQVDSEHVELLISDNGAGMAESVRTRVFDPFFTTKDIGAGTGQGLTLCYNIVKGH
ncbi:MAG: PAS domain S-box protein, partial [Bdellovibrionales bacterium]|nr:PAS domain S-box protein [Bdellovibrionales bacterium]